VIIEQAGNIQAKQADTFCTDPAKNQEHARNICPNCKTVLCDVARAALYLVEHREECLGRSIPVLKERFGLRNIEAIEATKIAHGIEYGRAV